MGNCLVTKLKETVNNDSLATMDEFVVKVVNNDNSTVEFAINCSSISATYVRCTGSCYFTNNNGDNLGQRKSGSGAVMIHGNGYVFFGNKYEATYCELRSPKLIYDFANLVSLPIVTQVLGHGSAGYGDMTGVKTNASRVIPGGSSVIGSMETLIKESPNLTQLNTGYCDTLVNLEWFEGKTSLTCNTMGRVEGDFQYLANVASNIWMDPKSRRIITGSIEGYVTKAISLGKSSGTFTFDSTKDYLLLTYNGTPLASNSNVPAGGAKFTWDAQGNITWSA